MPTNSSRRFSRRSVRRCLLRKEGKLVDRIGDSGRRPAPKKNGQQRGAENVESVAEYLGQLDRTEEMVPLNPDGGPNYSEIARHCGFGRQVFYTNEKARALVEQRIERFAESHESQKVTSALHKV